MASHGVLQKDDNGYPVMGGVSSADATQVKNAIIDSVTGRLKVDASGGSGTVTSITAGTGLTATASNPITASGTIALDSKLAPLDTLGSALDQIRVNAGATALEYFTPGAGSGTVTTVSVASANGFAGTVANATTTPAITLTTSITGVLKGNATAISAATAGSDYAVGSTGLAGGQTIAGGTLTTQILTLRGNAADTTTGSVAVTTSTASTTKTTGALTVAGGVGVAGAIFSNDLTVTNTITGSISGNAGTATSLTGGSGGTIPYQSAAATTAMLANGTAGQVLTSQGTTVAPHWTTPTVGTVTAVSVATANGVSGSSSGGATPALTISLGAITPSSVNGNTITTGTGTLTLGAGKTITINDTTTLATNAITLGGGEVITFSASNALSLLTSGTTSMTFPQATDTVAVLGTAQTYTATMTEKQVVWSNNAITASGNAATVPITSRLNTVTNNSAATLTITMTTTSAVDGQLSMVRVLPSSAAAQTITWVNTENSTVTAPILTNATTTSPVTVGFQYNGGTSLWRCIASA